MWKWTLPVIGLLLVGLACVYWLAPAYLPGVSSLRDDPELQTVSEEEFAKLLNASARRHQRRNHDHESPVPDTKTAGARNTGTGSTWSERYDSPVRRALDELAVMAKSPVGDTNFVTRSLDGETTALSDSRGHWRLVNFWATWCAPCREEMPAFENLQQGFSDQRLSVIGINIGESESTVQEFVRNHGLKFTILLDQTGRIGSQYGTFTLPETWLISPNGTVLGVVRGPREWNRDPSRSLFKNLLNDTQ